jgi:hypothetical protein
MTKTLFISLLFVSNISVGQTTITNSISILTNDINGDSISTSPNSAFNYKIKLAQIDKSDAKIDIRLYELNSLSNTKSVRRLFLLDKTWRAIEFDEMNKPIKIKKHNLTTTSNFDSLFLKLLSLNILTLPNQSSIKNKMYKIEEITPEGDTLLRKMQVLDGESFIIEIKIGNKFRVYEFDNPEAYSKFYDKVVELKDYLGIVQAFSKLVRQE